MATPSYASDDWTSGNMRLRSPSGAIVTCTWLNNNGDTPKVVFSLCGDDGTTTDVNTSTTNSLEAYLMYVDAGTISGASGYGGFVNDDGEHENTRVEDGKQSENLCVVYWDGTEWSFDSGHGYEALFSDNENESVPSDTGRYYNKRNVFVPTPNCFILARFYAESPTSGITSMEQYIDNTPVIYSTTGVDNLFFFIQAYTNPEVGDDFLGCVFFDDFEVYESEEFYPDVDVRKKLSTGNYGTADLTEYYDRELQPEQYKDSQAPLEAQFYFYPTYPTNQIFDTKRTPMYEDFKRGFFYIYDVDWGDGTPKEFTSEPEQIDEEKVILHTYETHGIFEVTGYMLRVKVNENGELLGVVHNKRFSLRINVNEGLDEDFQYFGSDGFSFIPYKNTLPLIGGYSEQSIYYKSLKRNLGIIDTTTFNNLLVESELLTKDCHGYNGTDGANFTTPAIEVELGGEDGWYKTLRVNELTGNTNTEFLMSNNVPVIPGVTYVESFDLKHDGTIDSLDITFWNSTNEHREVSAIIEDLGIDNDGNFHKRVSAQFTTEDGDIKIRAIDFRGVNDDIDGDFTFLAVKNIRFYSLEDLSNTSLVDVNYKRISDRLQTELAFQKMDDSYNDSGAFDILNYYQTPLEITENTSDEYLATLPFPRYFQEFDILDENELDRKSTRLNSSHSQQTRMPSSA